MSSSRLGEGSSSHILLQLRAQWQALTAPIIQSSEFVFSKDPEGKIPDGIYEYDMHSQDLFRRWRQEIRTALSDIDLINIDSLSINNSQPTIYYDASKHADKEALKQLINQRLPELNITLEKATDEQIEEDRLVREISMRAIHW